MKKRRIDKACSAGPLMTEMESRVLLSADLPVGLADSNVILGAAGPLSDPLVVVDIGEWSTADAAVTQTHELIIIDSSTPDYEVFVNDLIAKRGDGRSFEVVILDADRDGIEQITELLAERSDLSAVHIISHGSDGSITLGDSVLDYEGLISNAKTIQGWGDAFTDDGDLLIYGCNLAAGADGRAFINTLGQLTGADVAASVDLTGDAAQGGDWDLEYHHGIIEADVALSVEAQRQWDGVLAIPTANDDPVAYSSLVTSLGPLGYWRLGESSGTTVYDETGTNNGTNVNGSTLGQGGALTDEPANTAIAFDGTVNDDTGDFIEIAHDASYELDDGSIQLWFNTSDVTQTAGLFSKDSTNFDTGGHVTIELTSTSHVMVRLQSTTTDYIIESTTVLTPGEWHHVVFTFGSDGMRLYVDGKLEATDPYTGGLATTSGGSGNAEPIALGASTQASGNLVTTGTYRHFDGIIDEVAIFGVELSPEQVRNLYGAASQHYTIYQDTTLNTSAAGGVLANDYDADDDPLTAVLVTGPTNAQSFTLNADGSFDYTPTAGFIGTDTFTYRANDGTNDSNLATVTLTVEAVTTANALWISTDSNVVAPGADGLPGGWLEGEVLEFGGVDLAFGASTDGDFSSVIDFDTFALDPTDVGALHFVGSSITVGGGANTFDLQKGDVLVSFNQ
ncbi:MAG: DUF4347 domain-containing protein, partial [Gammaproteobacteria bacterium]